jgi:membrane-anchored glycerophosphoryl diester phosphodiesterase (GDPDase)
MMVRTIHFHSESTCSLSSVFHRGHVTVKLVMACSVAFVLPYMPLMFDMQTLCLESGSEFLL